MFTSIFINNFRCFEELSIESFDRVNLIAGKNNVGKTALLEAIFLLTGGANITLVFTLAALGGIHNFNQSAMGELLFDPLFSKLDRKGSIPVFLTLIPQPLLPLREKGSKIVLSPSPIEGEGFRVRVI